MAIEIREISIKTDVVSHRNKEVGMSPFEVDRLKKQLMGECKQLILQQTGRKKNKR